MSNQKVEAFRRGQEGGTPLDETATTQNHNMQIRIMQAEEYLISSKAAFWDELTRLVAQVNIAVNEDTARKKANRG